MATFVIVHGAWSGAHAWRWVRPLLREAGHHVFTPCLTGLGERAHLATPEVDLETHVQDVAAVLYYEDLREVVLVGHSYGGMVITGVAARAVDRVRHLVYIDAEVPLDGESEFDLTPPEERTSYEEAARTRGEGWRIPPPFPQPLPPGTDPTVVWAVARMVPQPLATFTQRLHTAGPAEQATPVARTYVLCTEGKEGQATPPYVDRIAADPAWHFVRLPAGHTAHVTAPSALAAVLVELAVD
jgi:pimeloyl-ACP methyl ester carboxylesterase